MYVNTNFKNTKRIFPMQGRGEFKRFDMNENPSGLPSDFIEKVFSMPVLQYYTQKNNDPAYTERQNEYMRIYEYNGGYAVIREWVASGCKEEPAQIEDLLLHVSDYGR